MADLEETNLFRDQENCPPEGLISHDITGNIQLSPDLEFPADPELAANGWERRFMADPVRVEEATRLYTDLGFEVRTESIDPDELSVLCGDCRLATCQAFLTLYTRKTTE